MADLKPSVKKILRTLHLYYAAHWIWIHRPDLKITLWNLGYQIAGSGDHVPIPPVKLIFLTTNSREVSWFLHSGRISFGCLQYALEKNGYSLQKFHKVLDFGCGCGRVLRLWYRMKEVHKYGSDYNSALIKWDQSHLHEEVDFQINDLTPPLKYADNFFDFIYALSVFTHFPENLQTDWMDELYRVLEPNGLLLITLHGKARLPELENEQKARFLEGQMVVIHDMSAGENICGAYHPIEYVRNKLAYKFEFIDSIESGARDLNQDIYLLRKPAIK